MTSSARLVLLGFTLVLAAILAMSVFADFSGVLQDLPTPLFMAVAGGTSLLQMTLTVVYAIVLVELPGLSVEARLVWLLAILFTGPAGMLCYWLVHVKESPSRCPSSREG